MPKQFTENRLSALSVSPCRVIRTIWIWKSDDKACSTFADNLIIWRWIIFRMHTKRVTVCVCMCVCVRCGNVRWHVSVVCFVQCQSFSQIDESRKQVKRSRRSRHERNYLFASLLQFASKKTPINTISFYKHHIFSNSYNKCSIFHS